MMPCSHFHLQKKATVEYLKNTGHWWNLKCNLEITFSYNIHLDILSLRHFMWNDHCLGLNDIKSACLKYACNITACTLVIFSDCEGNLCLVLLFLSIGVSMWIMCASNWFIPLLCIGCTGVSLTGSLCCSDEVHYFTQHATHSL